MRTLYRATIMLSVLGAAGWAVVEYGAAGAVRPFTTQAIELADRLIGRPGAGASTATIQSASSMPQSMPQLQMAAETKSSNSLPSRIPAQQDPSTIPTVPASGPLAQLRGLGARDLVAATWGASGQLHRVCCEVPLSNSQAMTQHFEAVATSTEQAAALLLDEIHTWRAARGSLAAQ